MTHEAAGVSPRKVVAQGGDRHGDPGYLSTSRMIVEAPLSGCPGGLWPNCPLVIVHNCLPCCSGCAHLVHVLSDKIGQIMGIMFGCGKCKTIG